MDAGATRQRSRSGAGGGATSVSEALRLHVPSRSTGSLYAQGFSAADDL